MSKRISGNRSIADSKISTIRNITPIDYTSSIRNTNRADESLRITNFRCKTSFQRHRSVDRNTANIKLIVNAKTNYNGNKSCQK